MKNIFYLTTLVFILTLSGCKGGKHAPQTDNSQANAELSTSTGGQKTGSTGPLGPTYADNIKPLFEKNCIPCHDKTSPIGNWLDYKTVFAKRALIKNRIFEKKDMPLGKSLADKDRALIAKWIDTGAVESYEEATPPPAAAENPAPEAPPVISETPPTTTTPTTTLPPPVISSPATDIDSEKLTYAEHIKPFFEKYCSLCHNENSGTLMPNWLQYDIVVLKKDALLDRVVNKKNMPPEGMMAPSLEERELLNLWIQKGLKYEIK